MRLYTICERVKSDPHYEHYISPGTKVSRSGKVSLPGNKGYTPNVTCETWTNGIRVWRVFDTVIFYSTPAEKGDLIFWIGHDHVNKLNNRICSRLCTSMNLNSRCDMRLRFGMSDLDQLWA